MQATAERQAQGRRRPGTSGDAGASGNGHGPPPYSPEAERALAGALLQAGQMGTRSIEAAMVKVMPEEFYDVGLRHVVTACYALAAGGRPATLTLVAEELRRMEAWRSDLGAELVSIQIAGATPAEVDGLAEIVHAYAHRRHMLVVGDEIKRAARAGDDDAIVQALAEANDGASSRPELAWEDLGAVLRGEEPEIVPTMLYRADGRALIYPGLLHWVMGEPGCGKTWLGLLAELATVQAGTPAMYLDYEGSQRIVGHRLARLGATEAEVAAIDYARPSLGSAQTGAAAARRIRERGVGLVVIDGAAKAMARDGLDEDRASEVLGWLERMVWPLCAAGAAVMILDHVPKDKDGRGRWARGSGAKLGEVDGAAYGVKVAKPWSRSAAGYAVVEVAKDREGVVGAVGDSAALLKFAPSFGGGVRVWVDVPDDTVIADTIHSAVLRAVNDGGEMSQIRLENEVRQFGKWRNDTIRAAAETLASQGRINVRTGPRNARLYSPVNHPVAAEQMTIESHHEEDF